MWNFWSTISRKVIIGIHKPEERWEQVHAYGPVRTQQEKTDSIKNNSQANVKSPSWKKILIYTFYFGMATHAFLHFLFEKGQVP